MISKRILLPLAWLIAYTASIHAQSNEVFDRIFGSTRDKFASAKSAKADVLSPGNYDRALTKFKQAVEDFKKGRALSDIDKNLRDVNGSLAAAMKTAELGEVVLAAALRARDSALQANAPDNAPQQYDLAARAFYNAARKLEDGDSNAAQEKGREAEALMREAELHAIKNTVIGPARNDLNRARELKIDRLAPATFNRALQLLNEAENLLNTNRYEVSRARTQAEAAAYEIRHANYLATSVQQIKANDSELERVLLQQEEQLIAIADELGFTPEMDRGPAKAVGDIRNAIRSLLQDRSNLNGQVTQLDGKLEERQRELNNLREAQAGLASQLEKEKRQRQEREEFEARFKRIEALFLPAEAKVLREGNNLRIRVIGLTFAPGKDALLPQDFALMTKLQQAIREFPGAPLTIEGHTDASGRDDYNQRLSTARAEAVRLYLIENMALPPERVQAIGYGPSVPIANNNTEAGRAQNRRIDVVISLPGS